MAQLQFKSSDTIKWKEGFGSGSAGDKTYSSNTTFANQVDYIRNSCNGTSGTKTITCVSTQPFSTGDIVWLAQMRGTGAGNWQLNKIVSGGDTTSITMAYDLTNTYTDDGGTNQAVIVQVPQYKNFKVNSGVTVSAENWTGSVGGIIPIIASESVEIAGTLSAAGKGFRGGTGQNGGGDRPGVGGQGESTTGAGTTANAANGMGGGGAGHLTSYEHPGGGGGGGHAAGGSNGVTSVYGTGGGTGGAAALTTAVMGGAGGRGMYWEGTTQRTEGGGGASGGIIFIFAKNITISGSLNTNGGNGIAGYAGSSGDSRVSWSGGGGGAGGSCLLKAVTATLGTNKATSAGGSGGGYYAFGGPGGAGSVGRIHLDYSGSYTGTTSPTLDASLDPTIKGGDSSGFFLLL